MTSPTKKNSGVASLAGRGRVPEAGPLPRGLVPVRGRLRRRGGVEGARPVEARRVHDALRHRRRRLRREGAARAAQHAPRRAPQRLLRLPRQQHAHAPGAEGAQLPRHDAAAHAHAVLLLRVQRRLVQHVGGLLERAAHERRRLQPVDAVAVERHDPAVAADGVDEQHEVAVVDVRAVEADHAPDLLEEGVRARLDAEERVDLPHVVGRAPVGVDARRRDAVGEEVAVHVHHVLLLGRQRPGGEVARRRGVGAAHLRVARDGHRVHEHARRAVVQHALVLAAAPAVLEHRGQLEEADEEVPLHGVDLRGEDGRPVAEAVGEDGADDRRRQAARAHDGLVEREAHDRRRAEVPRGLEQQLGAHLAVLARRVLEAEHGALRHDVLEARVGQRVGEVLGVRLARREAGAEPHGGARRLRVARRVEDLLHARQPERDVLRRAAREVEGVERHLGRRLADALRGDAPHALAVHALRVAHALVQVLAEGAVLARAHPAHGRRAHRLHEGERHAARAGGGGQLQQRRRGLGVAHARLAVVGARPRVRDAAPHVLLGPLHVEGREHARVEVVGGEDVPLDGQDRVAALARELQLDRRQPPRQLRVVHAQRRERDALEPRRVHAVAPPARADDVAVEGRDAPRVVDVVVLHRLVHAALQVAGLARLDGRVDEPLAPADAVEEELRRREAERERVADHPAAHQARVAVAEAGQRALAGRARDALPLERLLPEAGADLRQVDEGALGPRVDHVADGVVAAQVLVDDAAGLQQHLAQDAQHRALGQRLLLGRHVDRLRLDLLAEARRLLQPLRDLLLPRVVEHHVGDADVVRAVEEVRARHALRVAEEAHDRRAAAHAAERVDDAPAPRPGVRLLERAAQELAGAHEHRLLGDRAVRRREPPRRLHVQLGRQELGEQLPAGPEPLGGAAGAPADDQGRRRERARAVARRPDEAAGPRAVEDGAAARHEVEADEPVLHHPHHRLGRLRADDLLRHRHQRRALGARHQALRHVQVHLVPVEVRVVRRRRRQRQAEGVAGHERHAVRLHAVHVQRRLPVEDDHVVVGEEALDDVAGAQHDAADVDAGGREREQRPVAPDDAARAAHVVRAAPHALRQLRDVELAHRLGHRQHLGDLHRDAHAVDLEVRVRRDHAPRREVDALAHQVAPHPPLLAAQPVAQALAVHAPDDAGHAGRARDAGGARHEQRALVLQPLDLLVERRRHRHVGGRRRAHRRLHLVRALEHLEQADGQVVLPARARALARVDGRPRRRGRHRHVLQDHVARVRPRRVEAKQLDVLVAHVAEDAQRRLRRERRAAGRALLGVLEGRVRGPVGHDAEHVARVLRARHRAVRAGLPRPQERVQLRQPHRARLAEDALRVVLRRDDDARAREAEGAEHLEHHVDEAAVVDRERQLDVPRVTLARARVLHARGAEVPPVDGSHERVQQPAAGREAAVVQGRIAHAAHRLPLDLLRRQDAEDDLLRAHGRLLAHAVPEHRKRQPRARLLAHNAKNTRDRTKSDPRRAPPKKKKFFFSILTCAAPASGAPSVFRSASCSGTWCNR